VLLVEALRYHLEDCGFDSKSGHWIFHSSGPIMALESTHCLTEMNTRVISWRVKVAGAWGWQPYADCLEILAA
jgi:hypothetical protein